MPLFDLPLEQLRTYASDNAAGGPAPFPGWDDSGSQGFPASGKL